MKQSAFIGPRDIDQRTLEGYFHLNIKFDFFSKCLIN